jgi:hypothetical protein
MIQGETVFTGAPHPGTELCVMRSAAGYYLGFYDTDGMPYSRETQYFQNEQIAEKALRLFTVTYDLSPDRAMNLPFLRNANYNGY